MTETNAERLERFKNMPSYKPFNIPMMSIRKDDFDWLIEQAERQEDMDMYREYLDREKNRTYLLERENKRLREALEVIRSKTYYAPINKQIAINGVHHVANKALEPPK